MKTVDGGHVDGRACTHRHMERASRYEQGGHEVAWKDKDIILQTQRKGENCIVRYGKEKDALQELCKVDETLINPEKVGCMTGTLIDMYATGNGRESDNKVKHFYCKL